MDIDCKVLGPCSSALCSHTALRCHSWLTLRGRLRGTLSWDCCNYFADEEAGIQQGQGLGHKHPGASGRAGTRPRLLISLPQTPEAGHGAASSGTRPMRTSTPRWSWQNPALLALHTPRAEGHSLQDSQVLGQPVGQPQGCGIPHGIVAEPGRREGMRVSAEPACPRPPPCPVPIGGDKG